MKEDPVGKPYFSMLRPDEPNLPGRQENRALPLRDYARILKSMYCWRYIILMGALLLVSCSASPTTGGFDAASPVARSNAIQAAVATGDLSAISRIVEQLDADDPAIRMMAIEALQRLTGETYGYKHYDPAYIRREAIAKWVNAVQSGTVPQLSHSATAFRDAP